MKKISTPYQSSFKIFPFLFFGFIAVFIALAVMGGAVHQAPLFIAAPCVMAVVVYVVMRVNLGNLADEVYDCGDFLLVRSRGDEEKVPLSNIINVNFSVDPQPARITLTLARPGKFGKDISFALPPRMYLSPLPRSEVAEDLIARVYSTRSMQKV